MKILYVTNQIPFPPDNGVRIPTYHAMRLMSDSGHQLAINVLTEEVDDLQARFNQLKKICAKEFSWFMPLIKRNAWEVLCSGLFKNSLFFVERYRTKVFREKLRLTIAQFKPDVIHFDLIPMVQYREIVPKDIRVIASINDSYALTLQNELMAGRYRGWHKLYRQLQFYQVCRYEAKHYPDFNFVHTMTNIDADFLHRLNPDINVFAIPNGVDPTLENITHETYGENEVVFVANLVAENLIYLRDLLITTWPKVLKTCPDAKLRIVGKLGEDALAIKSQFSNLPGVLFTGYVDCLAEAYRGCGIAVVPVNKNCGIINKAIEAMAAGLAVIGFHKTFAGISQAENNKHFISVDAYETMADGIVKLYLDTDLRKQIQFAAHEMAIKYYSWDSRQQQYDLMYSGINIQS